MTARGSSCSEIQLHYRDISARERLSGTVLIGCGTGRRGRVTNLRRCYRGCEHQKDKRELWEEGDTQMIALDLWTLKHCACLCKITFVWIYIFVMNSGSFPVKYCIKNCAIFEHPLNSYKQQNCSIILMKKFPAHPDDTSFPSSHEQQRLKDRKNNTWKGQNVIYE